MESPTESINESESEESYEVYRSSAIVRVFSDFLYWGVNVAHKSVNVTRQVLKDEEFLSNEKPEVLEIKQNLTEFLKGREESLSVFNITTIYGNITDHYLNLKEEEKTPEAIYIKEILEKYHADELDKQFNEDFTKLIDQLMVLFEDFKDEFNEPLMEWLEELKPTNSLAKKFKIIKKYFEAVNLKTLL